MTTTGDRYAATAGLTTTEIAKRIRADLKAAQKDGELDAALRFSVRTAYFAGGSEITVTVKNYIGTLLSGGECGEYGRGRWTPQAREVAGAVRRIVDAHNRDGQRFYSHVEFAQLPGATVP